MEKLLFAVAAGAVAATALILAGTYLYDNASVEASGLTNPQKSGAIDIALRDAYVQQLLSFTDNYTTGNVISVPQDYYSYSSATSRAIVPIDVKDQYFESVLMVTVDLDENRTVTILNIPPGITYDQPSMDAINIVQRDPVIGDMLNNSGYGYSFENQTTYYKNVYVFSYPGPHENGNYGLLNDSKAYVDVSVQTGEMNPIYTTVTATVDTATGKVIMARFQDAEQLHPPHYTVTIRPGAAFYRQYTGFFNHSFANYSPDYSAISYMQGLSTIDEAPGTAAPLPIFVDSDNFEKLKNGTSYQTLDIALNRSERGWQAYIPKGTDFYLVLKNDDALQNSTISLSPQSILI